MVFILEYMGVLKGLEKGKNLKIFVFGIDITVNIVVR